MIGVIEANVIGNKGGRKVSKGEGVVNEPWRLPLRVLSESQVSPEMGPLAGEMKVDGPGHDLRVGVLASDVSGQQGGGDQAISIVMTKDQCGSDVIGIFRHGVMRCGEFELGMGIMGGLLRLR